MKLEKINIAELKENPKNVRVHSETQIREFVRSIEQFGVIRPVVIDENNMIIIGHGLIKALKSMGKTEVQIHRVSGLNESQKNKLMLADNKIYTLGSDNFDNIDLLLSEIKDFDIPGYNADDLRMIYGDKTIEEQLEDFNIPEKVEEQKKEKAQTDYEVPQNIQDYQKENEKLEQLKTGVIYKTTEDERPFILCPNCAEKILL